MKEKLKKIFTNISLWECIVGIILLLITIFGAYIKGVTDGLLIEDEIRTEVIDRVIDETKKPKNENEKKSLIDNGNYNYTFTNEDFLCLGHIYSGGDVLYYLGVEFLTSYNIYYDNLNYTDTFLLNYIDFSYYFVTYDVINDMFLSNKTYYTIDGSFTSNRADAFGGTWRYTSGLEYSSFYANSYLTTIISNGDLTGEVGLVTYINNDTSYIYDTNYLYSDYYAYVISTFMTEYDVIPSYYMYWIYAQQLYTCENNLQNKAVINVSMFQNLYEVFELFHGGATEEEVEQAYWQGYNDRKNSVEESETTINSIWGIIEKGVVSVLEVLNIQILPGIPLYICIVVPILLGVLLWVIKLGAQ